MTTKRSIQELIAKIERDGDQGSGPSTVDINELIAAYNGFVASLAANFEARARNIATHNQRSHTANTQQRKNMEIMHRVWSDAGQFIRDQIAAKMGKQTADALAALAASIDKEPPP